MRASHFLQQPRVLGALGLMLVTLEHKQELDVQRVTLESF